ncbi:hypothetical protein BC941DRAFT_424683 [Chlamydoabsidia padenii]|nr:hypothetical protein BC941DRAFT_424683 [Chlamydoabsidia padenii]
MNITDLLSPCPKTQIEDAPIHDDDLMSVWEQQLYSSGFCLKATCERNTLTDAILTPIANGGNDDPLHPHDQPYIKDTAIHIKVIGRHMNGSFRCHIGTGKASRPIQSQELGQQMRLLAVFFRAENSKSQLVAPDFIFFPTWLFHLFRYTKHDSSPGRTDVRFLEDASMAKEDHIYRLNHVLNSLFRFNLHNFNIRQLWNAVALANFLFDKVGLDCFTRLSSPSSSGITPPVLYATLINYLHAPRPVKYKPMCTNCNSKAASRRKLCVACYRYHLKHGEPRPLRLITANRPGPRHLYQQGDSTLDNMTMTTTMIKPPTKSNKTHKKHCANCGVQETHQWYRNLCGQGHWCETCKSYYLRHNKVRPPELFVKAAKRKVDVRSLVSWATWAWDHQHEQQQQQDPMMDRRYSFSDPFIIDTTTRHWTPSGCRPHLYHPRNNSNSGCNSPNSISPPSTPPSNSVHNYMITPKQQHPILPSLQRSFQDYDPTIFNCL